MQKFICSCPGKVLLAGGYAILNPDNHGVSIAINARFRTERNKLQEKSQIIFKSEQFSQEIKYSLTQISESENIYFDAIQQVLFKNQIVKDSWYIETKPDQAFYTQNQINKITKLGLGSSACLIVSCLGQFINDNYYLYELAQQANMIAQQNKGSGFDISTAIYGSQLFSKKEFKPLDGLDKNYQILLIDLKQGQSTIKGINTIQKFLSENQKYKKHFLEKSEKCVLELFDLLKQQQFSREKFLNINQEYRYLLRELGLLANYEIEPEISTEIINFSLTQPSTLWGICPGAGGYDAIAILCKNVTENEINKINEFAVSKGFENSVHLFSIDKGIQRDIIII
ncbi:unnamed protein product [Paramecium sonneborni]|uniref:GHMP kinase N-terminal domain-containing protein n=1 Tax=Paramecium sonneborni TaxID=65129 RepID=A0A8S1N7R1_9CILI|nr:unnamed protein product [Paramecium sonneborni]